MTTESILSDALRLPATSRAALIDELIHSLDRPDPALDALWLAEARSRLSAYQAGLLESVDADEVFAALDRHV